ncbi:hypothetical protein B4077_3021 [Bacillus cereus]|uniref:Uncharacterized protein n=1 Tax=Bacillus cereus TaxID=1396 RepID=A0A0G8F5K6_BACCE|nr:hypothetical protein B4077_3021 [Bacillus cereus]
MGSKLDIIYRDFQQHANGWKSFYQTVDLFSIVISGLMYKKNFGIG